MKVLGVGGGGREHAIVKALRRSGAEVSAAMGNQNPGIRRAAKEVLVHDVSDVPTVVAWAKARGIDLAVIGPEAPLAAGIVDALDAAGIPSVGPDREGARLETSKEFTRDLMREHKIPGRSEEHTSELQSQSNLVCRLLLEKKKQGAPRAAPAATARRAGAVYSAPPSALRPL